VTAYGLRQWRRSSRSARGLVLGNKAYEEHRYEEAASQLGRYLAVERDDVPILLKYADAHLNIRPFRNNNLRQAEAAYRVALREDKHNSEAATKLIELYLGIGEFGEAELIATRYLETNQDLKIRRMLAIALEGQRKFDEAATELKNIIVEHPEQILAYETLGQLTEQRPADFPDPPEYWFSEAVKNNPSSALAYIIRAAFLLRNKDKSKALADLQQAEKLDLSEPVVRLRLAGEFINANILDKAEKHLEVVQVVEASSQALWRIWTTLALRSNSKAMMLKVADTGLKELSYQPWDFMPTAAELYIRCGRLDHAADCISKLRQKDIAPPITEFVGGLLADREDQLFEAAKCFRLAIQIGNKSPRVRLALASVLSRAGDAQSATRQLRTLVSESPDFFDGHLALARMLAQRGNWAEVAEQAREAGIIYPNSLDATLLSMQARMQLIAESPTSQNAMMWQNIDTELTRLEETTNGALKVKLVQFQCAMLRDNFTEAKTLITELKKVNQSEVKVALAEVELLAAQGREDRAIVVLNKMIGEFPEYVEQVRYLAILLARQDNHEKCEAVIKDALTRIEQPAAKRELALLLTGFYRRWNEHEKCYQLLDSLARDLPDDILAHRGLLRCERVIKDYDRAQQLVDKIKAIEGEQGWQWRYEQARIWFADDNFKNWYPQIISLLKENLRANPDDQASRMLLARSYERAGELKLAIANYRDAYDRSHRDLRVIVAYVSALYKAKEYEVSDEILQRAAREKLYHTELKKFEVQSYLRRGELGPASDVMEDLLTDDPNNIAILLSLARIYMWQNKFAETDELLAKLKILEPNSLPVAVAEIELNVRRGKSDEAIEICNGLINRLANASAYIIRARTFVSLGDPNKAIEDFNHAVTIEPENVAAWVARSEFYLSKRQLEKAIADIKQALSIAPSNIQLRKRAISLLLASKSSDRVREGKSLLEQALKKYPDDVDLLIHQARSLIAEETAPAFDSAEQILQKITKDQPAISEAWELLGELSLKQGEYEEAVNFALHGLVHKPNDRTLLLLKARALKELSPALAIPTLRLLLEMEPNDVDIAVLLTDTYIAADEPEKAVSLLRRQLAAYSGTIDERKVKIALLRALYKNGDKAEAQELFDSLLQSSPDEPDPLIALVGLLKDDKLWNEIKQHSLDWFRNHPEDSRTLIIIAGDLASTEDEDKQAKNIAEDLLRIVLANDPNSLPAMNALAMLLQVTDHPEESVELYQSVHILQPDNVIVINNLAWLMCEEQGKHQEALGLAQRGLKIAPNYVDLIDTRGVAYYRLGEYEKAVQDFNTCLTLYPKGTPAATATYFHLGRALFELGRKEEAIENLKKALKLNAEIGGLSTEDIEEIQHLIDRLLLGD